MSLLRTYRWEVTHLTVIAAVIASLTLVVHLTGIQRVESQPSEQPKTVTPSLNASPSMATPPSIQPAHPVQVSSQHRPAHSHQSDPRQIVVGPNGISNRYTLLGVDREPVSSTVDQLTVRLQVESLATANLVSPFESDMLEIRSPDQDAIKTSTSFHQPIPSGGRRNQDLVFRIPSSLNLSHASLQIHYFNYQNEIPLSR